MSTQNSHIDPVAVLISVYRKDSPYLFDRALKSIYSQSYKGEIRIYLCIDGKIPEDIEEVVQKHLDKLFLVVRNDTNLGLAKSLNHLLKNMQGEAFAFRMDSDDWSTPDRFEKQIAEMIKRPKVDILGGAIREVDEAHNEIRLIRFPKDPQKIRRFIAWRSPLAHPTVCFRKSAIERFKAYPETAVAQDWALWFKCLQQEMQISNIDDVVLDLTMPESLARRRSLKRATTEFKILCKGILGLYGLNWRLIYALLRFIFRLLPSRLVKIIYNSALR